MIIAYFCENYPIYEKNIQTFYRNSRVGAIVGMRTTFPVSSG